MSDKFAPQVFHQTHQAVKEKFVTSRSITDALVNWALAELNWEEVHPRPRLRAVAGDASSRKYFRLSSDSERYVVAYAPPATEKNEAFLAMREVLEEAGVRVPRIFAVDMEAGYWLLEDLGDEVLLGLLSKDTAKGYYEQAMAVLARLAAAPLESPHVLPYSEELLTEELGRFQTWFVEGLLGYSLSVEEQAIVDALYKVLIDTALEQPKVLVHRDFHSRNLMLVDGNALAVIDFQDAVAGPITYDLVSLLRDCYIRWPPESVIEWANDGYKMYRECGLLDDIEQADFLRWFDLMGLQRHLKVLGTFARLNLRDSKTGYLNDLPLVLRYVQEVLRVHAKDNAAIADFQQWFRTQMLPLITEQDWSFR